MSYNVVFENTTELAGHAFVRTFVGYESQENFQKVYRPNGWERVIAEGVSNTEATNLCYLTPNIAVYTHAIEEIFKSGDTLDLVSARYFLFDVADEASSDTQTQRRRLQLHYSVPEGLEAHLATLCVGETLKARFMKAVIDAYLLNLDRLIGPLAKQNLLKIEPRLFDDLD